LHSHILLAGCNWGSPFVTNIVYSELLKYL
jgi:hypothetical protein